MKIAIVHEQWGEYGGAERVAKEILKLFPGADFYTSYGNLQRLKELKFKFPQTKVHTTWFQYFPFKTTTWVQLLSPFIWFIPKLLLYDVVIISTGHFFTIFSSVWGRKAVVYHHCPPKNLYGLEKSKSIIPVWLFSIQKKWYQHLLRGKQLMVFNSEYTQKVIQGIGKTIGGLVIYPPVDVPPKMIKRNKGEYYLILSRIDVTKNLEIGIEACREMNVPLIVAGGGDNKYLNKLKSIAGKKTVFLGYVSEKRKYELLAGAKALLFCSKNEDFGITPVEAFARGVPVVAFRQGGVKETIIEGENGIFFNEYNIESLKKALGVFDKYRFDNDKMYRMALKYSQESFRNNFTNYINKYLCTRLNKN